MYIWMSMFISEVPYSARSFYIITCYTSIKSQQALSADSKLLFVWTDVKDLISTLADSHGECSIIGSYKMDTVDSVCPSRVRAMLASRACRSSVMIGDALGRNEMRKVTTLHSFRCIAYLISQMLKFSWMVFLVLIYLWSSLRACEYIFQNADLITDCFRFLSIWQVWSLLGIALMAGQPCDIWSTWKPYTGLKKTIMQSVDGSFPNLSRRDGFT